MNSNILSLLGLALRGGRLAVGEEPAALAAKTGQARLLLLASDAADNTTRRAEHLAQTGHCLHLVLPFSKAELGGALGRGSAAIAALTDTGLATAVTQRLAALDPERYSWAAERMELKLRRARERKAAPRRDPPASRRERGPDGRSPDSRGGEMKRGKGPDGHKTDRPRHGKPGTERRSTYGGKRPYDGGRPPGKPGDRERREGPSNGGSRSGSRDGRFSGAGKERRGTGGHLNGRPGHASGGGKPYGGPPGPKRKSGSKPHGKGGPAGGKKPSGGGNPTDRGR